MYQRNLVLFIALLTFSLTKACALISSVQMLHTFVGSFSVKGVRIVRDTFAYFKKTRLPVVE